ncbi:unnamed protein product [Rodentolepis nana]|uniref:Thymidine phosphorylase n=1 Tax=Rodentolepis nana TaxID=102285 RepID=A0A0R3T1Y0_RODNA|nr:unnamed protein product [Rodentolepis nana]
MQEESKYISQLLNLKGRGMELSKKDYDTFVKHLCNKTISAVQLGAFLMAVFTRGMTPDETANLTSAMVNNSEKMRWSDQKWAQFVVDKQSTGGVGDKTSHILGPMIAACGGKVPMISGRGLGIAGGTIDKLESIEGYSPNVDMKQLKSLINDAGFFIVGQNERMIPADRPLYKYRDVTGTVASIPLITGSILSRKLCEGLRGLVMDIKLGIGALFQNLNEVRHLARTMISVGEKMDLKVVAVVSSMDQPLGQCSGNALEMAEVFSILSGGPFEGRLKDVVLTLGHNMLSAATIESDATKASRMMLQVLNNGKVREAMAKMLVGQGVSSELAEKLCSPPPEECPDAIDYYLETMGKMADVRTPMKAPKTGYISEIDARAVGQVVWRLGAGRDKEDDSIDHTVGVRLLKKVGDYIEKGEICIAIEKSGYSLEVTSGNFIIYQFSSSRIGDRATGA